MTKIQVEPPKLTKCLYNLKNDQNNPRTSKLIKIHLESLK